MEHNKNQINSLKLYRRYQLWLSQMRMELLCLLKFIIHLTLLSHKDI